MTPAGPRPARPWDRWSAHGIIADLDGVLLDSTEARRAQWRWWANRVDADPEQVTAFAAGRRPADVVARFAPEADADVELTALGRRAEQLLRACRRGGGVRAFVRSVPPNRLAIVTGLGGTEARAHLQRARVPSPAVLVTGDDVDVGRPDPAGHRLAAGQLGIDPTEMLAIETTAIGLQAAHTLGMTGLLLGPASEQQGVLEQVVRLDDLRHVRVVVQPGGVTLCATREPARWR